MPVPGRDRPLPSQGQLLWANTLAIRLDPTGGRSEGEVRCGDLDKYQIWTDKQSKRYGIRILAFLNRASLGSLPGPEHSVPASNEWKSFMLELVASDSLLTSRIHDIKNQTEKDNILLYLCRI